VPTRRVPVSVDDIASEGYSTAAEGATCNGTFQRKLTESECVALAISLEIPNMTSTSNGLPQGCVMQNIDNVLVFVQHDTFVENVDWQSQFCTEVSGVYSECQVDNICSDDKPWTPEYDVTEDDLEGCTMTAEECQYVAGVNVYYEDIQNYIELSEQGNMTPGCYGNAEGHLVHVPDQGGLTFNVAPTATAMAFCSEDLSTPVPTPQPTPMPTWSDEPTNAYVNSFYKGCHLALTPDECRQFATDNTLEFVTANSDVLLPRGCYKQFPNEVIFYNANPNWVENEFSRFCPETWDPEDVPPALQGLVCTVMSICRKEDFWEGTEDCDDTKELNERVCQKIGENDNIFGRGFETIRSNTKPKGCFGDMNTHQVFYNKHSRGKVNVRNTNKYCKSAPKPPGGCESSEKYDSKPKNRWCQKKCDKKKKALRKCNARCLRKCTESCRCNKLCPDSETWFTTMEMSNGWFEQKNCLWVAEDPETRCRVEGTEPGQSGDVSGKKACPEVCGRCPKMNRRLTTMKLV